MIPAPRKAAWYSSRYWWLFTPSTAKGVLRVNPSSEPMASFRRSTRSAWVA